MRLRLVHASRANRFMRDILEGIAHEAGALGVDAVVVDDAFSPDPDTAHVVVPHEYFAVTDPADWPDAAVLGRTIALTVEHPGTPWFEVSAAQARRCGAVMDINRDATAELRRRGVPVLPFQIGYSEHWDHWRGGTAGRDVDIVYLGSADERRDRMLAAAAPWWADVDVHLLIPAVEPKPEDAADSITGAGKYDLLARSRILVNAHRLASSCLEWVRVIEALANGCVVVSEHSTDGSPLRVGEHYVSARIETLGLVSRGLLDDPDELDRLRRAGYDFIRSALPLRASVEVLVDLAQDLVGRPRPVATDVPVPPRPEPLPPAWPRHPTQLDVIGSSLRRIEQRMRALEREVRMLALGGPGDGGGEPADAPSPRPGAGVGTASPDGPADPDRPGPPRHRPWGRELVRTPAMDLVEPRISVITALYNHGREVGEALASVVASRGPAIEVLVLDDASTDDSADVAARFLDARPWLPGSVWVGAFNRGPSAVRNELLARARGELVFVLDADNGVYPDVLTKLTAALDADPGAAFAYAPIAVRHGHAYRRLVSSRPWRPEAFRQGNSIDAMALLRTQVVRDMGGWDSDVDGWEDFHLWVRMAEAGRYAAFVPQVLSWYRESHHSLSIEVAADHVNLWSRILAAAPTILHE